jgi:hypothetical protein
MSSATFASLKINLVVGPSDVLPSVGEMNQRFVPNATEKYRCLFAELLK